MTIREKIRELIENSCKNLFSDRKIKIDIAKTSQKEHGDYTANIKGLSPEEQEKIVARIKSLPDFKEYFLNVKFEKPIFVNFLLSPEFLRKNTKEILKQKEKFGSLKIGKKEKINVEFISANPTGPLHIGNARGGFYGDVLANIFEKANYKAFREYYINIRGEQVHTTLKNSLEGSEDGYKGPYIDDLKKKGIKDPDKAADIILKEYIKPTIGKMKIKFDLYFYDKELDKEVDKILKYLESKSLSYEKEGATWFKSTQFGDDKDRVLIKSNKEKTYFLYDIAYLKNKFNRGFKKLIFFWGAEHHGYISRIKAATEALGRSKENVIPIIMQLVKLFENGKEVKMSKRTGTYVTIDELLEEVGLDVARFFFLIRNADRHLLFDLDLAKEQSEKNPVYYIQYAYARICNILNKIEKKISYGNYELLKEPAELGLIKELIRLPEIIEDTAKDYQVQRIPQYATDLAAVFHQFYRDCRVISEDKELTKARLSLITATKIVLKNALDLMGISAPEKM